MLTNTLTVAGHSVSPHHYINGQRVASDVVFDLHCPIDQSLLGQISEGTADHVDAAITAAQAAAFGVSFEIREGAPGAVLVNNPAQTEACAAIARELLGEDQVVMPGPTFMGSEDFAYYAQHKPGTYCFIGNGNTAMVHHPMYDFDDRNLPVGAAYWVALVRRFLA